MATVLGTAGSAFVGGLQTFPTTEQDPTAIATSRENVMRYVGEFSGGDPSRINIWRFIPILRLSGSKALYHVSCISQTVFSAHIHSGQPAIVVLQRSNGGSLRG